LQYGFRHTTPSVSGWQTDDFSIAATRGSVGERPVGAEKWGTPSPLIFGIIGLARNSRQNPDVKDLDTKIRETKDFGREDLPGADCRGLAHDCASSIGSTRADVTGGLWVFPGKPTLFAKDASTKAKS
jgi:hypothetical protein